MSVNGVGASGAAEQVRARLEERRTARAAVDLIAASGSKPAAADPAGVAAAAPVERGGAAFGLTGGPAGARDAAADQPAADPAGVARARADDDGKDAEVDAEGGEDWPQRPEVSVHVSRLELGLTTPGAMADPAGVDQANAAKGVSAYRRARDAAEGLGSASPGISIAV